MQEVDEPLQIDMSELCLTDDFIQPNSSKNLSGLILSRITLFSWLESALTPVVPIRLELL